MVIVVNFTEIRLIENKRKVFFGEETVKPGFKCNVLYLYEKHITGGKFNSDSSFVSFFKDFKKASVALKKEILPHNLNNRPIKILCVNDSFGTMETIELAIFFSILITLKGENHNIKSFSELNKYNNEINKLFIFDEILEFLDIKYKHFLKGRSSKSLMVLSIKELKKYFGVVVYERM